MRARFLNSSAPHSKSKPEKKTAHHFHVVLVNDDKVGDVAEPARRRRKRNITKAISALMGSSLLLEQVVVELKGARQVGVDAVGENRQSIDVRCPVARNTPTRTTTTK